MITRALDRFRHWRLDRLVSRRERLGARADAVDMAIIRLRQRLGLRVVVRADWCPDATRGMR